MTYRDLAVAVVYQAVRDAVSTDGKAYIARRWLVSDDARLLTEPLNIDVTIEEWVSRGCPATGRMMRIDKKSSRDWHSYYENRRENRACSKL